MKIYTQEPDREYFLGLIEADARPLMTSLLARVEVESALHRKESAGELSTKYASRAISRFAADISSGRIVLAPLNLEIAEEAARLIRSTRITNRGTGLGSLDALHLATALNLKSGAMVTTDARLREASLAAGLGLRPSAELDPVFS